MPRPVGAIGGPAACLSGGGATKPPVSIACFDSAAGYRETSRKCLPDIVKNISPAAGLPNPCANLTKAARSFANDRQGYQSAKDGPSVRGFLPFWSGVRSSFPGPSANGEPARSMIGEPVSIRDTHQACARDHADSARRDHDPASAARANHPAARNGPVETCHRDVGPESAGADFVLRVAASATYGDPMILA